MGSLVSRRLHDKKEQFVSHIRFGAAKEPTPNEVAVRIHADGRRTAVLCGHPCMWVGCRVAVGVSGVNLPFRTLQFVL